MTLTSIRRAVISRKVDRTGMVVTIRRAGFAPGLAILLGFFGVQSPVLAQDTDDDEASAATETTDDTVPPPAFRVVVDNRTAYPIDIIAYDDTDGSFAPYDHVPPGGALDERVVSGLLWVFQVNDQALIGQYVTTGQAEQYVVLDENTLSAAGYPPGPRTDGPVP